MSAVSTRTWADGQTVWVAVSSVPADLAPSAAARLEGVPFEDWTILVPPLEMQRSVNQRRGLTERVAMIDALTGLSR